MIFPAISQLFPMIFPLFMVDFPFIGSRWNPHGSSARSTDSRCWGRHLSTDRRMCSDPSSSALEMENHDNLNIFICIQWYIYIIIYIYIFINKVYNYIIYIYIQCGLCMHNIYIYTHILDHFFWGMSFRILIGSHTQSFEMVKMVPASCWG